MVVPPLLLCQLSVGLVISMVEKKNLFHIPTAKALTITNMAVTHRLDVEVGSQCPLQLNRMVLDCADRLDRNCGNLTFCSWF